MLVLLLVIHGLLLFKSQILELASVLCNKLDFLEVSRQGVSNLKILLIEMEVRVSLQISDLDQLLK